MKTKKTLSSVAIAAACVLALASCNQSDDITPDGPQPIRFSAAIGEQAVATPQTRAAGTYWHTNDAIGIFMVKNKETAIAGTYAGNKKFTTERASRFLPESGHEIYFPLNADDHVDFIAYYPYKDVNGLNMESEIDLSTVDQTKQREFDMMWGNADNAGQGYNKNFADNIPLGFVHRLARLTMNCKAMPNTGLADLDGATVTIKGMNTTTTFAVKDGAIGTAATVADMTARKSAHPIGYLATYDAIIVPATYATNEVKVEFTVHGETYTWKMDPTVFESGNDYVYDVTLTLTGVTATGNISPWNTINEAPVYAE